MPGLVAVGSPRGATGRVRPQGVFVTATGVSGGGDSEGEGRLTMAVKTSLTGDGGGVAMAAAAGMVAYEFLHPHTL